MQLPPLSLYIHIPWCVRKCPYCDFNSHQAPLQLPETEYVNALLGEFDRRCDALHDREIGSVFFGGGTPSLFSPDAIGSVIDQLDRRLRWAADVEITLEANPGTVDRQRFAGFRTAGVNRLSIGVQSFDDALLRALGRIHGGSEALTAIEAAHSAGFSRVNVDLMYGLPGQSTAQALADLRAAIACGIGHLSWYELTIEPNTAFYNAPPALPQEDHLAAMEAEGRSLLAAAGYERYEISAYARPAQACRHNLNYWQFGDYLGLGAGAHSKLTDPATGRICRTWNTRVPADYLGSARHQPAGRRELAAAELPVEFMMNALRLTHGVAAGCFEARTGLALNALQPALSQLRERGLLAAGDRLCTTTQGSRFLDSVLACF